MTKDYYDIIIKDKHLVLHPLFMELIHANPGDRLLVGYVERNQQIIPIVSINPEGNLITKSLTVRFSGYNINLLGQFGDCFEAIPDSDFGFILEGSGSPIVTTTQKAIDNYLTKEIILDTTYNITKLTLNEF